MLEGGPDVRRRRGEARFYTRRDFGPRAAGSTGFGPAGCFCHLPREAFRPMLGMGLGMRPLPRPPGLVLFPGSRLCVGDVGERYGSAIFGLAERFNGCVDPSSCPEKRGDVRGVNTRSAQQTRWDLICDSCDKMRF